MGLWAVCSQPEPPNLWHKCVNERGRREARGIMSFFFFALVQAEQEVHESCKRDKRSRVWNQWGSKTSRNHTALSLFNLPWRGNKECLQPRRKMGQTFMYCFFIISQGATQILWYKCYITAPLNVDIFHNICWHFMFLQTNTNTSRPHQKSYDIGRLGKQLITTHTDVSRWAATSGGCSN